MLHYSLLYGVTARLLVKAFPQKGGHRRHKMLQPILQTPSAYGFQLASHVYRMLARCTVTLLSRMERAAESGRAIAEWLARNDVIKARMLHPEMAENDRALALRVAE